MNKKVPLSELIENKTTFNILVALNFVSAIIVFYIYRNLKTGDEDHYINYAIGLSHGRYSFWSFLPQYIPDTLRNPGYPVFLYLIRLISENLIFAKCIQLLLYFISVFLVLKIADKNSDGYKLKNIFLLLLLPYIQIVFFSVTLHPEALMTFLITLTIYIYLNEKSSWGKYLLLGLLSGIIFQVRPVFIFFPFIMVLVEIITYRKNFRVMKNILMIVLYILTMIPYAMWNYRTHDVFSITPLEGGGGVMQAGYWSFLLPGYRENRYWGNIMSDEIISFTKPEEIPDNIIAFNKEWDFIDSSCASLLTKQDSINVIEMKRYPLFKTYSAKYTLRREQLLKQLTIQNLEKNPWFTFKIKAFTAIRLWVTSIQNSPLYNRTVKDKIGAIYSFIITGIIFLLSILFIPLATFRKKLILKRELIILSLIIYFGLIHIPFSIQARYTIPVRLFLIYLLAISLVRIFENKTESR